MPSSFLSLAWQMITYRIGLGCFWFFGGSLLHCRRCFCSGARPIVPTEFVGGLEVCWHCRGTGWVRGPWRHDG